MVDNKIIDEISRTKKGISIEKYINFCLFDSEGYYNNINPIGRLGDFITSPEISQLFGEILGLYIYNIWKENINNIFNLIESGRFIILTGILNSFSEYLLTILDSFI